MKTSLLTLLCLLYFPLVFSQDVAGVKFFAGSWKEALTEAKRQQKPLFVDLYTTWCAPCKQMDKEAFPNPELAARYNTTFVNYKLDAEKGEGPVLAKQYAVAAYPTSLYVNADGVLLHRSVGYPGIKSMLAEADKVLLAANSPQTIASFDREYANGNRDIAFLRKYLRTSADLRQPNNKVLQEYVTLLPDDSLRTRDNLFLIASNLTDVQHKAYASLLEYLTELLESKKSGDINLASQISSRMRRSIESLVRQATQEKNEALLEQAIAAETKLAIILGRRVIVNAHSVERQTNNRRLLFLHATKQTDRFQELALATANQLMVISDDSLRRRDEAGAIRNKDIIQSMSTSLDTRPENKRIIFTFQHEGSAEISERLWSVSSLYSQHFTGQADIDLVLAWNKRALSLHRNSSTLMNHSTYLYKAGKVDESTELLREAIVAMKEEGRDTAMFEEVLVNRPARK